MRRPAGSCRVIDGGPAPFGGTWVMATGMLTRLRGLARRPPDRTVLVLPRCRDVHTMTMRHPIDVAFVGAQGMVLEVHRLVLPGVRLRHSRAVAVVERFAQSGPWFMRGDVIEVDERRSAFRGIPRGKAGGPSTTPRPSRSAGWLGCPSGMASPVLSRGSTPPMPPGRVPPRKVMSRRRSLWN